MKTWKTPTVKSMTFEEMSKTIRAKADSNTTSCQTGGACSCGTQCNPLALYWSCHQFAYIVGR